MDKDKTEKPLFCLKGEITFARDKKDGVYPTNN